ELHACRLDLEQIAEELDHLVGSASLARSSSERSEVRSRLSYVSKRLRSRRGMGELSDELDQIAAELQRLVAGPSAGMPLWAVSFWGVVVAVVAFVVGGGVDFKIGGSPKWTEVVTAVVSVVL